MTKKQPPPPTAPPPASGAASAPYGPPLTAATDPHRPRYLVVIRARGHAYHYWQPTKAIRDLGWLPRRLADGYDGAAGARAQATAINAQLDRERAAGPPATAAQQKGTIAWLVAEFEQDRRYLTLGRKTQTGYDQLNRLIVAKLGDSPIAAVTRPVLERWYNRMYRRTPWQAAAVMRMLHRLLHVAWCYGQIATNPAAKMELVGPPARQQLWEDAQTALLVDVALACERPSVALAALMARELGQRKADTLALTWRAYDAGRFRLRQLKTGKWIEVTPTEELAQRLDATPRVSTHIVVSEGTGRPYGLHDFSHTFQALRDFAALLDPTLADLQYRDFRRTCVVELARAGATPAEIAAITGQQIDRVVKILEVYLPRDSIMAEHAIVKLEAWKRKKQEGKA